MEALAAYINSTNTKTNGRQVGKDRETMKSKHQASEGSVEGRHHNRTES